MLVGICVIGVILNHGDETHKVHFADDLSSFTVDGIKFDLVYVNGGDFFMGVTDSTNMSQKDEYPRHRVKVPSFYIGKYPVTQEQWKVVMGNNPSYYKGDNHPVEGISWFDAIEYLRKLSILTGREFTLPTEAMWEYAAIGGEHLDYEILYSGDNNPNQAGWYADNSSSTTHPVGLKKPNKLGLYDMSGNVWEWCTDYYDPKYYSNCWDSISDKGPQGAYKANWRVFRGGSIQLPATEMRVNNRDCYEPSGKDHDIGFRLIMIP